MHVGLSALLLDWRRRCPYNQDSDCVFALPEMHGKQPLWPSSAMSKHIRLAAERAGSRNTVAGTPSDTLAILLKGNNEDVKTTQELLRHADRKVTLELYTHGIMGTKKAAQQKVFEAIVPIRSRAIAVSNRSA